MSSMPTSASETALKLVEPPSRKGPAPLIVRGAPGDSRLVFPTDPGSLAAEQYRVMRRRLTERYQNGGVILVTSPGPGDGKTVTSTNLAWCLAESGVPTLLAELDLRKPNIAKLLGYTCEGSGLDTLLATDCDPESILRQINKLPFHVAAAGRERSNRIELLTGENIAKFLNWARQKYRWVVLDSPPLFPLADSLELSSLADFTMLVVRARVTPRVLVEKAAELLGPRLQQVMINEGSECTDSSYRYISAYYPYGSDRK